MKTENLKESNSIYSFVYIRWNDKLQPILFHTINEAIAYIQNITNLNQNGIYHIITPYAKYFVYDPVHKGIKCEIIF